MSEEPQKNLKPSMWECKDFADGWISYFNEEEALTYQRDTGCALRITYKPTPSFEASR